MKIEEMKTKAAALCEKLQSAFRGVASIAWDNAPDADPEAYDEFTSNMNDYEKDFGDVIAELTATLNAPIDKKGPATHDDRLEFLGQLIDVVEDFLDVKGVEIENPDRDREDDNAAIIYGSDYDVLSEGLEHTLVNWDLLEAEETDDTNGEGEANE